MGFYKAGIWVSLLVLVLFLGILALPVQAATNSRDLSSYEQAFVLTNCSDYSCIQSVVKGFRDSNQLVSIVFPEQFSMIALIQPEKQSELISTIPQISSINFEQISDSQISLMREEQQFTSRIWNKFLIESAQEEPSESFEFNDTLIMPESGEQSSSIIGGGSQTNWDPSSIYTSEYMIGDVVVAVLMPESEPPSVNTENWTSQEVTDVTAEVTEGLNWWVTQFNSRNFNSNLYLTWNIIVYDPFTYSQMHIGYEPIELPMGDAQQEAAVDAVMFNFGYTGSTTGRARQYAFLNNLRNTYSADWAFIAWTVDSTNGGDFLGGGTAAASLGGPRWNISATYFTELPNVNIGTSHETGHTFWALDQYLGSATCYDANPNRCTYSTGYLNIGNQNCNATIPCATDVPSVMRAGISGIDQYGSWQIGWKDTIPANGIPDVLETPVPTASIAQYQDPTTENYPTLTGSCNVGTPVDNQNPFNAPRQDITILDIENVQYRADGGQWNNALASDSAFDEGSEDYNFTTFLANSATLHTVEAVCIDTLNQSPIINPSDSFIVWGTVGEQCPENLACSTGVCKSDQVGAKYCVSNTNNCAMNGSEAPSGAGFARSVVNRQDSLPVCFQGYWGEDPLLASTPSTSKTVAVEGSQIVNTTVSIMLPKLSPVTSAAMFVSAMSATPINNINIDIGNDGSIEKTITSLSEIDSPQSSIFTNSLNSYVQNCTATRGTCTVPIGVSADNAGIILLHGLDIQYNKWLPVQGAGGGGGGFMQNYSYVRDVMISSSHPAISIDNTITIALDTASLIPAKMQTDCDDLRVFDTVSQIELDRDIQNCGSAATTVSWKASQALGANIADSTTYDLYYGYVGAGNDHRDLTQVYRLYDDFEDGSLSSNWTAIDEASESGGNLVIVSDAGSDISGAIASNINVPFNSFIEARVKTSTNSESGYVGFSDQTNAGISLLNSSNVGLFQYVGQWVSNSMDGYPGSGSGMTNIDSYAAGTYKTFKVDYQSNLTSLYSNGILRASRATVPPENSMHPGFDVFCVSSCSGSNETLSVDWVKVAFYVPSSALSLGDEMPNAPPNSVPVMDEISDITNVAGQTVNFLYGATDADGDNLTYSNSYNLTSLFSTTNWTAWNTLFNPMTFSGVPWNVWSYINNMSASNSDAGIYYVVAKVSDGVATVGQIVEINILPNNSRPVPSLIRCIVDIDRRNCRTA